MFNAFKNNKGAGEAQQLQALIDPLGTQILFPALTWWVTIVAPGPEDPMSPLLALCKRCTDILASKTPMQIKI